MTRTFSRDRTVVRFHCNNSDGKNVLFKSSTMARDIRLLVYLDLDDLDAIQAAMEEAEEKDPFLDAVTCETSLLAQVRDMITDGPSFTGLRTALQAALALVDAAIAEDNDE